MPVSRVTHQQMTLRALSSMQGHLSKLGKLQDQLSSGKALTRPSDSPTGTSAAMRLRDQLATLGQYQRNAQDGLSWLGTTDTVLTSITDQARTARDLGLQGANDGSLSQSARDALAQQVDGIRTALIGDANTTYLGRPVFGGITAGATAYDASGTYVGQPGVVNRTVGDGVKVRVDTDAANVFGAAGDTVFDHLSALSTALRANDNAGVQAATAKVTADLDRVTTAHADVGTRYSRLETVTSTATDTELSIKTALTNIEDVDVPKTMVDLSLQTTAYQASLSAVSRVNQQSLMDFLR